MNTKRENIACRPGTTDAMQRLAAENEALRAENERLKGAKPEFPPFPPHGDGLPRYGIRWNGQHEPLAVQLSDGYWTPWHLADALRAERDELAAYVERIIYHLGYAARCLRDTRFNELWEHKKVQGMLRERPAQSVAHIRAAGAREALDRAMQPKNFSNTVVRVDAMREIIEQMEKA